MKKNQVFISVLAGAALLGGAAFAEPDQAQGLGPRGDRPGFRPEGSFKERMQQRGPGAEGRCPMMRREGFGPENGPKGLPDLKRLKEAGATDQQLEALKKFEDEQQLKRIDLKSAVEKAEVTFQQQMKSETLDEAATLKAADALSQARAEAFKEGVAAQLKARTILGADVLKKLHERGPPAGFNRPGRGPGAEGQAQPCKGRGAPPAGERPPRE